jgi:poly-gamma-glutamate synthesis protein (capsule biosynthesis protein)
VLLLEPVGPVRLRIAAMGDVAVIGRALRRARREGFDAVFAAAAPHLRAADLGCANLEAPIGARGSVLPGRSAEFRQDEETALALARSGVRVLALANNHMMDCGPEGVIRTRRACLDAGLDPVGAGADLEEARRPASFRLGDTRVVVLAYGAAGRDAARPGEPGIAPLEPEAVRSDLLHWRGEADVLVVCVHWGSMYVDYPPPRVLELALVLGDLADVVLGTHPHVLQGYRRSGRNLTLFSLGDACFDSHSGEVHATVAADRRRESGVFTVLLADQPGLEIAPLVLDEDGVPQAPGTAAAAAQAARLQSLAAGLAQGGARFASESAPVLVRYELESLVSYLRRGRVDRAVRLLSGLRARHLPVLWQALRRFGRAA